MLDGELPRPSEVGLALDARLAAVAHGSLLHTPRASHGGGGAPALAAVAEQSQATVSVEPPALVPPPAPVLVMPPPAPVLAVPAHAHGTRRAARAAVATVAAVGAPSSDATGPSPAAGDSASRVGFIYDERMAAHTPPQLADLAIKQRFFEQPGRVHAILRRLHAERLLAATRWLGPRPASDEELLRAHTAGHLTAVDALSEAAEDGGATKPLFHNNNADLYTSPGTSLAARLAAGCVVEAVEAALRGEVDTAFALVRPPGHHAGCCSAEGFCFFNSVAVAARAAVAAGCARVGILDWDVHHGNGTQAIFEEDPSVLYLSLHRFGLGFYPSTGAPTEVGSGPGAGRSVNVAFTEPHATGADYAAAFRLLLLPILAEFDPELILVSSGFDAALGDPLGKMAVPPAAFGALTTALLTIGTGRVVVALEGGYNEDVIAACSEAVLRALLRGRPAPGAEESWVAAARGRGAHIRFGTEAALLATLAAQEPFWSCLAPEQPVPTALHAYLEEERLWRSKRCGPVGKAVAAPTGSAATEAEGGVCMEASRESDGASVAG